MALRERLHAWKTRWKRGVPLLVSRRFSDSDAFFDPQAWQKQSYVGTTIARRTVTIARTVLLGVIMLFVWQAFRVQILTGQEFRTLAERNRLRTIPLPAARGIFYDAKNRALVENVPNFSATLLYADLPSSSTQRDAIGASVARFGISEDTWQQAIVSGRTTPFSEVPLGQSLSYDQAIALTVLTPHLPGIHVRTATQRYYLPDGGPKDSFAHVFGYVGAISPEEYRAKRDLGYLFTDVVGKTAAEASFESLLHGTPGFKRVETDAVGRVRRIVAYTEPKDGYDIRLTIDARVQQKLEEIMKDQVARAGARRASAVLMDPRDGSIRALVSLPGFDPNIFSAGVRSDVYDALTHDDARPLIPRAINGSFPSGSTFKPVVATAFSSRAGWTPTTTL
jgi:penicillin-binding protein 2